jgi:glycine oxidase
MRIVVAGGGLIGTCFALEAHSRGAEVFLVEATGLHSEASTAGAGILGAEAESVTGAHGSAEAVAAREAMFAWLPHLEAATGLTARAARRGTLVRCTSEEEAQRYAAWCAREAPSGRFLAATETRDALPSLGPCPFGAYLFDEDGALEPARLGSAVSAALRSTSVEVRCGHRVAAVATHGERARGVTLDDGSIVEGDVVVVAAGAWSAALLRPLGIEDELHPLRGQLLELRPTQGELRPVLFEGKRYIVPRGDGRYVVGSTMERVGFTKQTTTEAREELLAFVARVVPAFADAEVGAHWCGLRPFRTAGPRVGSTALPGLFTSIGHGRNGILFCRQSALDLATALGL